MRFCLESFNTGLHLRIYREMSLKLGIIIGTKELHFDTSLVDRDLHSNSQLCEKSRNSMLIFLVNSDEMSIQMKCGVLLQPVGILKLMLI